MRYGERTARGIIGESEICSRFNCALVVLGERRNERYSKRNMVSRDMVRDIASSRASAADWKTARGRNNYSAQSTAGQLRCLGQAMKKCTRVTTGNVTRPSTMDF